MEVMKTKAKVKDSLKKCHSLSGNDDEEEKFKMEEMFNDFDDTLRGVLYSCGQNGMCLIVKSNVKIDGKF